MASAMLFSPFLPSKFTPLGGKPRKRNPNPNFGLLKTSASSSPSPPETECPVPSEQQPVNEYQALATSTPFSWAAADLGLYCSRLTATGAAFALLLGLPVAAFGTRAGLIDPQADGLRWAIGSISTGLIGVTFAVLRMYLGWAYVGNRLLSATVECGCVKVWILLLFIVGKILKSFPHSNCR